MRARVREQAEAMRQLSDAQALKARPTISRECSCGALVNADAGGRCRVCDRRTHIVPQPESGWAAYWRANGAHRNHTQPVAGCRYCLVVPAAALLPPLRPTASPEPALPAAPGSRLVGHDQPERAA